MTDKQWIAGGFVMEAWAKVHGIEPKPSRPSKVDRDKSPLVA